MKKKTRIHSLKKRSEDSEKLFPDPTRVFIFKIGRVTWVRTIQSCHQAY